MMLITGICILLTLGYVLLMLAYARGWALQPDFALPQQYRPATFISVIIPARNEQHNIGACIDSILQQQYPAHLFEIIVVDDHSEDGTADIVRSYPSPNVRYISLLAHLANGQQLNAYKKAAIALGISQSKGSLIITTDADCIAPPHWLSNIAAMYEHQEPVMIVAPVIYNVGSSVLQAFQLIDFMSMQGITAAAHRLRLGNMSNGANLAFSKAAYEQVSGYEGITHLASGDDYLLMMKMNRQFPGRIAYLKSADAIVITAAQPTWAAFFQQRIRWASKSGKYNDATLTSILLLVYLFNSSILAVTIASIFYPALLCTAAAMLLIKIMIELLFLVSVARFFRKQHVLWYFPFLQPLHIIYIVLAGFLGCIGTYKWKGRSVR